MQPDQKHLAHIYNGKMERNGEKVLMENFKTASGRIPMS